MAGPGTEIKKVLAYYGITANEGCGCTALAAKMDRDGADKVEEKIEGYIAEMREGIKKWRGRIPIPIPPDFVIRQLIEYGIKKNRGQ